MLKTIVRKYDFCNLSFSVKYNIYRCDRQLLEQLLYTVIDLHIQCRDRPDISLYLVTRFGFMVLNATFNNISVISWWSVFLVEETGVPGENHRPATSY